ncbi:hypothetical protein FBU30_000184 [Linnemannia zychae]|nr:hypothetical protein FBU30_000184 [Linnemannia zychae]
MDNVQYFQDLYEGLKPHLNLNVAHSVPTPTPKPKSKMALSNSFLGKLDEWKTFSNHLTLYITANEASFPTDSDKILFAISCLDEGSAFKYMMQFVQKLKEAPALHPAIITNFQTFLSIMKETFGIQNANVITETQLLQCHQKGSAIDYTIKF